MRVNVLQNNYGLWTWAAVDDEGNQRGRPSVVGGFSTREDAIRDIFELYPDVEPRDIFADGVSLGSRVSAMKVPVDRTSTGNQGDPADIERHHPTPQPAGIGAGTGDAPRNLSRRVVSPNEPEPMPKIVSAGGARGRDPDDAPEVGM